MHIEAVRDCVLTLSHVQKWPELADAWREATKEKLRPDWQLPLWACQAVGGDESVLIPGMAAIGCIQMGIILIDDMLDNDPRGVFHRIGVGNTANLATALHAMAVTLLDGAEVSDSIRWQVGCTLADMGFATAVGQQIDANPPTEGDPEEIYWQILRAKSCPFYGTALKIGTLLGGASTKVADEMYKIGELVGEMVQIADDLLDSMATPATPDWTRLNSNLLLLYASLVGHPERDTFLELAKQVEDAETLDKVQQILINCGAVAYCDYLLRQKQDEALALLNQMSLVNPEPIEKLILQHRAFLDALTVYEDENE